MSSLWTPSGEHEVPRQAPGTPDGAAGDAGTAGDGAAGAAADGGTVDDAALAAVLPEGTSVDDLTPEQRSRAEEIVKEMAEARRRLLATPASAIIANHAMGLYELAALHLSEAEPDFAQASLAIDSLAALVDGVGERMDDVGPTLREALDQIRMAFVQVKNRSEAGQA